VQWCRFIVIKVGVTWARRLLRANDHLADAYLIVGVAEQAASHGAAARTAYRRYLELAPKGPYARDVRLSLAAL
jgi:predicted TPR repeat methyltransferase